MKFSTLIATAFSAATVLAAPTAPSLDMNTITTRDMETVSSYFNLVAKKIQNSKSLSSAPICDLSNAQMSQAPTPLPPASAGLTLKHVAIGRGVQNYTCDTTNSTAVPVAIGAVAVLYNASCVVAMYPDLANDLPRVALQFNLTTEDIDAAVPLTAMQPSNLVVSGKHFFNSEGTPFFNLDTPILKMGQAGCAKNSSVPAPQDAAHGQQGEPAVSWLKLLTKDGSTGDLQEVYRLQTAGGSAPATCKDMPAVFEVQYAAQYWFWEGPKSETESS